MKLSGCENYRKLHFWFWRVSASWFETVKCTMQNCTFQIFLYSYDSFLFLVKKFYLYHWRGINLNPKNSTYLRTQNRKMTHKITPCFCLSQLLSKGRNLVWGPPNENGGHRFIFPSKTIFSDLYTFFGYLLPQVHKKWVRLWVWGQIEISSLSSIRCLSFSSL